MQNNQNQNAVINSQNAKETKNMKKSNRTFESIIAEAKKQQGQLDNARVAYKKASTAAGKELAQKTGEKAKSKLEQLRQQYRHEMAVAKAGKPVEKKPEIVAVANKEAELKKKYHELKVRGINELVAEYRKEKEALRAKYAAKKEELINGLLKLYKEELADMSKETQPSVMEEVVEHLKAEVPCSDLKEELKEELELIAAMGDSEPAEASSFVPISVDGKQGENLVSDEGEEASIETAPVFVEAPVTESEEADAVNKTPAVEKVEVNVDPELDSIAASAMGSDSDIRLNHGETFLDENGNTYVVETFFEYVVFTVSDRAVQQQMIQEALDSGDIRMAKKAVA